MAPPPSTSSTDLTVSNLFSFKDYVCLVTGGATGLGEMAAQAFVQNGARVIIASRKESELQKTCDRLNKLGPGKAEYIVADLKDKAGCDKLVAAVKQRTDKLNVLINNSGATWGAPYHDFPESGWDKLMALNVKSIFYTTVGLEPLLIKDATAQTPSRVINIASVAGLMTSDPTVTAESGGGLAAAGNGTYSYGPSKAACIHLSRMQASILAPKNVNVNVICPGVFPSRMTGFGMRDEDALAGLIERQPTGRIGQPSDLAGLVLFLSSLGGAHMVGGVFEIDGGSMRTGWKAARPKRSRL